VLRASVYQILFVLLIESLVEQTGFDKQVVESHIREGYIDVKP